MTRPKAINRKKLVAFVLPIIAKGVDPMPNEKLEKLNIPTRITTACAIKTGVANTSLQIDVIPPTDRICPI